MTELSPPVDQLNLPKKRLTAAEMLPVIKAAETVRTVEGKPISLEEAVADLTKLIDAIDFSNQLNFDEVTGVLQAVRIKVDLLMKLSGKAKLAFFSVPETMKWLGEAKLVLDQWHRQERVHIKAKDHNLNLEGKPYIFEIELYRDTAKYLQKLGDLTGQKKYYEFAAHILQTALASAEPKNQQTPAAALARFERQINLDLAGQEINPQLLKQLHREILLGSQDNWDRCAAVSWWLYEYAQRHQNSDLMGYSLRRAKAAVIKGGEQTWEKYQTTRMLANFSSRLKRTQFRVWHGTDETKTDAILQKHNLALAPVPR